ncbi:MAG: beta-ketoacyl synthase chain length factor [Proteobacteria bacterium]|nr:beta-ketoacyl synthase chain length factor [Pseudomonadota bacterium]
MKAAVAGHSVVLPGGIDGLAADLESGSPREVEGLKVERGELDPRQWRRMSRLSRMAASAVAGLGELPEQIPLIWGTAYGESVTSSQVLDRIFQLGPDKVSPLAFQGSVYNAAAARMSLIFGLSGPTETISAGPMTGLATLAQGISWLEHHPEVLVVVGDERGWAVETAYGDKRVGEGCIAIRLIRGDDFEILDGAHASARDFTTTLGQSSIGALLCWLLLREATVERDGHTALTCRWRPSATTDRGS